MEKDTTSKIICSSDKNLKEHILDLKTEDIISVSKVENVRLKSFNFKDEPDRRVYGVIAQEVQEAALDDLVYTKDDGMLAVDYTSLLILKVAELEKYLNTARVAIDMAINLKNSLESLEKRVKELEEKIN